jgi:hypothetical protein
MFLRRARCERSDHHRDTAAGRWTGAHPAMRASRRTSLVVTVGGAPTTARRSAVRGAQHREITSPQGGMRAAQVPGPSDRDDRGATPEDPWTRITAGEREAAAARARG